MLTNIGHVTETLKTLLETELVVHGATSFGVTAQPPDATTLTGDRMVSVYLFHVLESADLKNLPSRFGTSAVPVRQEPMGLILQYIVTVVAQDESDVTHAETVEQQRLIGFIARAIHDYPVISDKTTIQIESTSDPVQILHADLRNMGTVIRFNMRPASMEETVTFWTAQDKNVPRLSLFVEARVIVLEPKPAEVAPGIVLSVGQFVFTSAEPQLIASRNETFFLPPNATEPASVRPSPARVALFDAPGSANLNDLQARHVSLLENNHLTIDASGLGPGTRELVLRSPSGTIRFALDATPPPGPNANWQPLATSSSISLRVFEDLQDTEGALRKITPSVYGVRVIVKDPRSGPTPRPRSSNEITFTVVPQILAVGPTTAPAPDANLYTLELVTASLAFRSDISLSVGGRVLVRTEEAPERGQFRINFATPFPTPPAVPAPVATLDFRLPHLDPGAATLEDIVPGPDNPLAVRLVIDGATANPEWLTEDA